MQNPRPALSGSCADAFSVTLVFGSGGVPGPVALSMIGALLPQEFVHTEMNAATLLSPVESVISSWAW